MIPANLCAILGHWPSAAPHMVALEYLRLDGDGRDSLMSHVEIDLLSVVFYAVRFGNCPWTWYESAHHPYSSEVPTVAAQDRGGKGWS
jgi:hypothetical protein